LKAACGISAAIVVPAALFILPWQSFRWALEIPLRDFAVTPVLDAFQSAAPVWLDGGALPPETAETLGRAWTGLSEAFSRSSRYILWDWKGGAATLCAFLALALIGRGHVLKRENAFLLCLALVPALAFAFSFAFSIREIQWHTDATPRLLLPPAALLCVLGARLYADSAGKKRFFVVDSG
jgi:hypothetical protein